MYNVYEHGKIYPIASYHNRELAEKRSAIMPNTYVMYEPILDEDLMDFDDNYEVYTRKYVEEDYY